MAAPTLQAQGATATGVTTGVPSIVLPTHQADDIVIVHSAVWVPNTTTPDAAQIPTPANYNLLGTQIPFPTASPRDGWLALFWRRVTGAGTTVTLTRGSGWDTGADTMFNGRAYIVRGCIKEGNPFDASAATAALTGANGNFPAVTVSGSERTVIIFGAGTDNATFALTSSGWTTGTEDQDTGGTDSVFNTARKENVSSSTAADATTANDMEQGFHGFIGVSFKPPVTEKLEHTREINDGVIADDAVKSTAGIFLADATKALDAQTRAVGKVLADAPKVADAQSRAVAKVLADAPEVLDAASRSVTMTLAEAAIVDDAVQVSRLLLLTLEDGLVADDALSWKATLQLGDALAAQDALTKAIALGLADTATAADDLETQLTVVVSLLIEDGLIADDSLSRASSLVIGDDLALQDALLRASQIKRVLSDGLVADDAQALRTALSVSDSLALGDGLTRAARLVIPETLVIADEFERRVEFFLQLVDEVGVDEAVQRFLIEAEPTIWPAIGPGLAGSGSGRIRDGTGGAARGYDGRMRRDAPGELK